MSHAFNAISSIVPMMGMSISLHTRRQVAQALRDRRRRDPGPEVDGLVCRYRPDGTLTYVNEAYCRFFRKRAGELVGTKFIDLIPEHARAEARRQVAILVATKQRTECEHEVTAPDGAIVWQHWAN